MNADMAASIIKINEKRLSVLVNQRARIDEQIQVVEAILADVRGKVAQGSIPGGSAVKGK